LCAAMSLLNGTARAALKRGIANNEIDRPKSLCICARYQRPVVESSFCEMRSWLVLRSRREPLHSRRLWRLRSSSATAEAASGRVRIMPSPIERQSTIGRARRAERTAHNHTTPLACPRCVSGCGGVWVFGSRFAISLAIRRQYILGAARTS
jgi:hypothetical protein